jgi:hypothetical protein
MRDILDVLNEIADDVERAVAEIVRLRMVLLEIADGRHVYGPFDPHKIAIDALGDYKDPWSR